MEEFLGIFFLLVNESIDTKMIHVPELIVNVYKGERSEFSFVWEIQSAHRIVQKQKGLIMWSEKDYCGVCVLFTLQLS